MNGVAAALLRTEYVPEGPRIGTSARKVDAFAREAIEAQFQLQSNTSLHLLAMEELVFTIAQRSLSTFQLHNLESDVGKEVAIVEY